jgi:hypothetical protein
LWRARLDASARAYQRFLFFFLARALALRLVAARVLWAESERFETVERGSRFSASVVARLRFFEGRLRFGAAASSRSALLRVASEV